jgi:hypothetical protein
MLQAAVVWSGQDQIDVRMRWPQDQGVHWFDESEGLPALLAEYGRLAAQLPDADKVHAERIHRRLQELDVVIDRQIAESGISQL